MNTKQLEVAQVLKYFDFGFKVYLSENRRNLFNFKEENILKAPSIDILEHNQLPESLNLYAGVGIYLGYNDFIAIDIDGCVNANFIKNVLRILGLPEDYEWITKTGSYVGFHILFRCKLPINNNTDFPSGEVNAYYSSFKNRPFSKIEFRWGGNLILPPSLHISGYHYTFLHDFPSQLPVYVDFLKVLLIRDFYCDEQAEASYHGDCAFQTIRFKAIGDQNASLIYNFTLRPKKYIIISHIVRPIIVLQNPNAKYLVQISCLVLDKNFNILSRDCFNYIDEKNLFLVEDSNPIAINQAFFIEDKKVVYLKIANYLELPISVDLIVENMKFFEILKEELLKVNMYVKHHMRHRKNIGLNIVNLESVCNSERPIDLFNKQFSNFILPSENLFVRTYANYFAFLASEGIEINCDYLSNLEIDKLPDRLLSQNNKKVKKMEEEDFIDYYFNEYEDN